MPVFNEMCRIVPQSKLGDATIVHDVPDKMEILRASLKGITTEDRTHVRLLINGKVWMTDTQFERRTNMEFVLKAQGNVLVAGLGIGLILAPLADSPKVRRITVVEISRNVIDLVSPLFPSVSTECADIWEWRPQLGAVYDTIYFDIWPDLCTDYLVEMTKLHRKFRRYLAPGGWINSWCREYLREEKRRGHW